MIVKNKINISNIKHFQTYFKAQFIYMQNIYRNKNEKYYI